MSYAKNILESKTFWFNLLAAIGAILAELATVPDAGIDPKWVLFAVAAVNIILRTMTTQPVNVLPKGEPPLPPPPHR